MYISKSREKTLDNPEISSGSNIVLHLWKNAILNFKKTNITESKRLFRQCYKHVSDGQYDKQFLLLNTLKVNELTCELFEFHSIGDTMNIIPALKSEIRKICSHPSNDYSLLVSCTSLYNSILGQLVSGLNYDVLIDIISFFKKLVLKAAAKRYLALVSQDESNNTAYSLGILLKQCAYDAPCKDIKQVRYYIEKLQDLCKHDEFSSLIFDKSIALYALFTLCTEECKEFSYILDKVCIENFASLKYLKALSLFKAKRYNEAKEELKPILNVSEDALFLFVDILMSENSYSAAIEYIQRCLKNNSHISQLYSMLGLCYYDSGRICQADNAFTLARQNINEKALFRELAYFNRKGLFCKEVDILYELIEITQKSSHLYLRWRISKAYSKLNRFYDALLELEVITPRFNEMSIIQCDNFPRPHVFCREYIYLLLTNCRYHECISKLSDEVLYCKYDVVLLVYKGDAYKAVGMLKESIESLIKAYNIVSQIEQQYDKWCNGVPKNIDLFGSSVPVLPSISDLFNNSKREQLKQDLLNNILIVDYMLGKEGKNGVSRMFLEASDYPLKSIPFVYNTTLIKIKENIEEAAKMWMNYRNISLDLLLSEYIGLIAHKSNLLKQSKRPIVKGHISDSVSEWQILQLDIILIKIWASKIDSNEDLS